MTRMRFHSMASGREADIMAAPTEAIEAMAASLAAGTARQEGVAVEEATAACVAALQGASLQTARAILTITSLLGETSLILTRAAKGSRERRGNGI